ncbi:hypothetical protein OIU77_020535 [Salix suchowensis]|uniref:Uncharacterized protein n=1 Tax=Salix suchowensis TaxID=1278906 RepID=A0ABQ9CAS8_9ROSI|nr:hypothetical protein OIU77_020535 [Salix suchowensis]
MSLLPLDYWPFASAGLAFPFYMASSRGKPVIDPSKPLPPQATFRGPYINTGSRDIGPDPGASPKEVMCFARESVEVGK